MIELRRVAKPASGQTDIVVSAQWETTWNKPQWIRAPMHTGAAPRQTDFVYVASGSGASLLQTATRPSADGVLPRPTYGFVYNSVGQLVTVTDPTGLVTSYSYDAFNGNRLTSTLDPTPGINAVTNFDLYDAQGDLLTVRDPRGNASQHSYDLARRKTMSRQHDGGTGAALLAAQRTTYDVLGRVWKEDAGTAFSGSTVTTWQLVKETGYTATSQVATVTNGDNETSSTTYDVLDRAVLVSDPIGRRVGSVFDAAGQLLCTWRGWDNAVAPGNCTWDPASYVGVGKFRYAQYTYSANGQLATVEDANLNRSAYEFDGFDRLVKLRMPLPTKGAQAASTTDYEQYSYNDAGDRTSLRKRDGQTIAYAFDRLNRQTVKDWPVGTADDVFLAYDAAGRPTSLRYGSTGGQGVIYGFDSAKRVTSEAAFGRTLGYQYDVAGNRTRVTWPDANYVQYTFDNLNRLDQVRENGATSGVGLLADYSHDALSRRTAIARGNGTTTGYPSYDLASRLLSLTQGLSGTSQDLTVTFGYTDAGQLQSRTTSNVLYDWAVPTLNKTYVPDGLNRYASVAGTSFSYDARGNLTSDGSRTFTYDIENRLRTVTGGAGLT